MSRTRKTIRRLRLEYIILLERLEERANQVTDGINKFEEMATPPTPNILNWAMINTPRSKLSINELFKKGFKKNKNKTSIFGRIGSFGLKNQKIRDPNLPKRPTNAYLIFCEMEKERIKQENEEKNPGILNDLSKSMTDAWKNLDIDDRKPYYKLYEDDKIRYQKEMAIYNKKKQLNDSVDENKEETKKTDEKDSKENQTDQNLKEEKVDEVEKALDYSENESNVEVEEENEENETNDK